MKEIATQFYDAINQLPAFSDAFSGAVLRSSVTQVAGKYLASVAEIFKNLTEELANLNTQLAEKIKEIDLLSQSNAQLLTERNQAAQELVNSGNRLDDISAISSKLIQARDHAEKFINKNLPELFVRMTRQTKLFGFFGLGIFLAGTAGYHLADEDSFYLKKSFIFIQVAGLLAIGTAIGSSLALNNVLKTQAAFARAI